MKWKNLGPINGPGVAKLKNLGPISSPGVENVKSNMYNGTVECR